MELLKKKTRNILNIFLLVCFTGTVTVSDISQMTSQPKNVIYAWEFLQKQLLPAMEILPSVAVRFKVQLGMAYNTLMYVLHTT